MEIPASYYEQKLSYEGAAMAKALPPLYALRAFEAAARTGSATGAAEELNLTQSAVSKHIKTLEAHFGRKLFHRHGPRLEVTPQGQIFADGLKHGFKQIEDACAVFQSERNVLRLKAPSTLTMRWLLDAVSRFRATEPGFDVQITSVWMDIDTVDFFTEPHDCAICSARGSSGRAPEAPGSSMNGWSRFVLRPCIAILAKISADTLLSTPRRIAATGDAGSGGAVGRNRSISRRGRSLTRLNRGMPLRQPGTGCRLVISS